MYIYLNSPSLNTSQSTCQQKSSVRHIQTTAKWAGSIYKQLISTNIRKHIRSYITLNYLLALCEWATQSSSTIYWVRKKRRNIAVSVLHYNGRPEVIHERDDTHRARTIKQARENKVRRHDDTCFYCFSITLAPTLA